MLHKKLPYSTNILLETMLLYRPGDWAGKCEDSWCFLRKSGISGAMFAAGMAVIRGHSNLLLIPDTIVDNKYTQQSTGNGRCRIWVLVGPHMYWRGEGKFELSSYFIVHNSSSEGHQLASHPYNKVTRQLTGDTSRGVVVVNTTISFSKYNH